DLIAVRTEREAVCAPTDETARIAIHAWNIQASVGRKAIDVKYVESPCCAGGRRILGEIKDPTHGRVRLYQTRCWKSVYNGQIRHIEDLTRSREDPFSTSRSKTETNVATGYRARVATNCYSARGDAHLIEPRRAAISRVQTKQHRRGRAQLDDVRGTANGGGCRALGRTVENSNACVSGSARGWVKEFSGDSNGVPERAY